MKIAKLLISAVFLAAIANGAMTLSKDNLTPEQRANPVIRIAIDMDPAEVVKKSSYPLDFSPQGQPFVDKAFKHGNLIVTANVDFEVLSPHRFSVKNVRYWGVTTQFDKIDSFSADAPNLTIDEAIFRAKQWVADIENSGWARQNFLYAVPERRNFNNWSELKEAFLLLSDQKIIGVAVGEWHSHDNKQQLVISIEHKREDGGLRSVDAPQSKDGENDKNYLLSFSVSYSDEVREYRGKHAMELRKAALKNSVER